jgi:hypothetical protein
MGPLAGLIGEPRQAYALPSAAPPPAAPSLLAAGFRALTLQTEDRRELGTDS